MLRTALFVVGSVAALAAVLRHQSVGLTQALPVPPQRTHAEMLRLSLAAEKPGLAEPFKGISADGQVETGLFHIRSTGVSTELVRGAAAAFLVSLNEEQRAKTKFAVDGDEWRKWMNQSFYICQGVSFREMSDSQRAAAFNQLRAGLSVKGLQQTRDIMRLNETLAELTHNNHAEFGEWQYHITVMGEPSASAPWG